MVEIHSSFIHPTTTNLHCRYLDSPPTTHNRMEVSPSPLLRDVGSNQIISTHSEIQTCCICPSPFQRDVGGSSSLNEGFGEREAQGGTQGVGGLDGASSKRTTIKIVVRFLLSISPRLTPTILNPHSTCHPLHDRHEEYGMTYDCGPDRQRPWLIQQHPAPPLPEGCGPVHARSMEELEMHEHKRGPTK